MSASSWGHLCLFRFNLTEPFSKAMRGCGQAFRLGLASLSFLWNVNLR